MSISVVRAGFLTAIQDRGRTGFRKIGVPLGGALDAHVLRVINLLVGNDDEAAAVEITFGGLQMKFLDDRVVAWGGGEFEIRVGSEPVSAGHAALVRTGEELTVGAPGLGCRAWIAISGGIDVPRVLGSRSTDWRWRLGGIDGRALRDGDKIPLGPVSETGRLLMELLSSRRLSSWSPTTDWIKTADGQPTLRCVRAADWNRFDNYAHTTFWNTLFTVSRDSNRMGVRLEGPQLKRTDDVDLISEAVAPGTIQVPPNGQPIILLGDCQTIGGYPKFAHVITVDLPIAAQLRAGDQFRFREVHFADAHRLLFERERDFNCFRTGLNLRTS